MHAVGCGHHCKACRHEETTHYERHKEIAELVTTILKIDLYGNSDGSQRVGLKLVGLEHEEKNEQAIDDDGRSDYDDTSTEASSLAPTPGRSPAAQKRLDKKALKEAKSLAKAQKHVNKFNIGPTPSDISAVARAIHGPTAEMQLANHTPTHSLDTIIERNIRYVAAVHGCRKLYSSDGLETNNKRKGISPDMMNMRVQDILHNLGLSPPANNMPLSPISTNIRTKAQLDSDTRRKRQNVLSKVQVLIREDIEKSDADQRETLVRMAGYWRYVNRGVYNQMLVNREHWEWLTGARVEDEELDMVIDDQLNDDTAEDDNEGEEEYGKYAEEELIGVNEADADTGAENMEADAELEAMYQTDDHHPLVHLAYARFVLMPENETAYEHIVMQQLEALAIAVVERDEKRATQSVEGRARQFEWKGLGPQM